MRNVNVNKPDVEGMFLMCTPPISSEFQVFSGGLGAVGLGASAMGATVDEGWLTATAPATLGDEPVAFDGVAGDSDSPSFGVPFVSAGLTAFGFWIGIAAF